MALAPLDAKVAGDGFGLANYNKLKADTDYLVVPGADLASAATITPTAEFHKVTGTTTIDNLTYAGAVAGQQVRLWFGSALTIRNNGGGTGNIRTATGQNISVAAGRILTFTYDGATWRESSTPSGRRVLVDRAEWQTPKTTTGLTYAAGVDLASLSALTFDGASVVVLKAFCPGVETAGGGAFGWISYGEGATALGVAGEVQAANSALRIPLMSEKRLTPGAGAHTYKIVGWGNNVAGTYTFQAGDGSTSNFVPGFLELYVEV